MLRVEADLALLAVVAEEDGPVTAAALAVAARRREAASCEAVAEQKADNL